MGAAVGLLLGLGLLAVWSAFLPAARASDPAQPRLLARAGMAQAGRLEFLVPAAGLCVGLSLGVQVLLGVEAVSIAAGVVVAGACHAWLVARGARRVRPLGEAWADALDRVAASLRAGLSLGEALVRLGHRPPAPLGPSLGRLARDVQASGRPRAALERWARRESDPVAQRATEVLLVVADRGDAADLLATLADHLREDVALRARIQLGRRRIANLARVALAVPLAVLAWQAARGAGWAEFEAPAGGWMLVACSAVVTVGFRWLADWAGAPLDRWGLA